MNYYERHLGDYARDAGHLEMLEHGAYTLLLDRYYTTEQGIPADQAHRVCRAKTRVEKAAVDAVLAEFFVLEDGAWINGRATREVAKKDSKVKAAQENGKRGGRPRTTKQEPSGLSLGSDSVTQEKAHQSPVTRHQSPDKETHTPQRLSDGGRVCLLLRHAGLTGVNPGHPGLLALIAAGCTDEEFVGAGTSAAQRGKGFAYAIGTLKKQREEAADAVLHQGRMPATETPYARQMREKYESIVPSVAAKKPGTVVPITVEMEPANAAARLLG